MKTFKRLFATFITGILSLPYLLFAQDEGTYIDNLGAQDSSYMEQDLLAEGTSGGTGTGTIIIVIVVILIIVAAVAYLMKKRKK